LNKGLLKNLFAVLMILTAVGTANAEVIITEVLYDPINTDSGGEFVELYNNGNSSADISGWTIRTETSVADATLPANILLPKNSHYLIADANWSMNKDTPAWPAADHEEAMILANADAGVALVDVNNTIMDAVGWGNAVNIGAGLFEGTPAPAVAAGNSLHRIKINGNYTDTQNNANDFSETTPSPTASSGEITSSTITVMAVVTGSSPVVINVTLGDDDSTLQGYQINPVPGADKNITITAVVADANGHTDISNVYTNFNSVSFFTAPGNYNLTVNAVDKTSLTNNLSAAFEYMSLIAIEVDAPSLIFAATPGSYSEVAGDANFGTTDNATLRNTGNVLIDAEISGTNLSIGSGVIPVSMMDYSFGAVNYAGLSHLAQKTDINLLPGPVSTIPLSFRLNVPSGTIPGNYTGSISLFAVEG